MTLDTLIATAEDFGSEAPFMRRHLPEYNRTAEAPASDIEEVYLDAARADLKLALPQATGYAADSAVYEDSMRAHPHEWRYLISRRQLALMYDAIDAGPGSLNRTKRQEHQSAYTVALASMRGLISDGSIRTDGSRRIML